MPGSTYPVKQPLGDIGDGSTDSINEDSQFFLVQIVYTLISLALVVDIIEWSHGGRSIRNGQRPNLALLDIRL